MATRTSRRGFLQNVRIITELLEQPCSNRFTVAVTTAGPALKRAAITLFTPSIGEILEEYLHPKRIGKWHKGAIGASGRWVEGKLGTARKVFPLMPPDVDEAIASKLPFRDFFEGRKIGALERMLWLGIDVGDFVLFSWMMVSLIDEFAYDWSSALMETRFCSEAWTVTYAGHKTIDGATVSAYFSASIYTIDEIHNSIQTTDRIVPQTPIGEVFHLISTGTVAQQQSASPFPLKLVATARNAGGGIIAQVNGPVTIGPDNVFVDVSIEATLPPAASYQLTLNGAAKVKKTTKVIGFGR